MLSWFSRLFGRGPELRPSRRAAAPSVRVEHDDKSISVHDGKGGVAALPWGDLASVTVMTNDLGPFDIDLFWILSDRDGRRTLTVPMGAEGEHALLKAMQSRLAGFDNMAVVEAMSSTGNGIFQIWPAADTF
jgi:hypothetical protein